MQALAGPFRGQISSQINLICSFASRQDFTPYLSLVSRPENSHASYSYYTAAHHLRFGRTVQFSCDKAVQCCTSRLSPCSRWHGRLPIAHIHCVAAGLPKTQGQAWLVLGGAHLRFARTRRGWVVLHHCVKTKTCSITPRCPTTLRCRTPYGPLTWRASDTRPAAQTRHTRASCRRTGCPST